MSNRKTLTATSLTLINLAAICNIKNFPLFAEYGLSIVFYLALCSLFFFLPISFVAAELASSWPEQGVYSWVTRAFGKKIGFLAVWLQWAYNLFWYPTLLAFVAGNFAYLIDPALAENRLYVLCVVLLSFWGMTLLNFRGMRLSGWISSLAAFLGTLLPMALIISLAMLWFFEGNPSQISFTWKAFLPKVDSIQELVLLSGVLFGLAGMEMSAVHAKDVKNPQKNYPKAIFLSALAILLLSTLGALSIAILIPPEKIQLTSSTMEAFCLLLHKLHLPWAIPLIALMITLGALGMMSTWIIGPARSLWAAAKDGALPPFFQKVNEHNTPTSILWVQAIFVSILSLVFVYMPSINSSYWALTALTVILYQIMYLLIFLSAIRLRKTHPNYPRPYRVPFGTTGLWICCLFGMVGPIFGLLISFVPPSQFDMGHLWFFEGFLIGGALLALWTPIAIFRSRTTSK